jgi:hypothetical protein
MQVAVIVTHLSMDEGVPFFSFPLALFCSILPHERAQPLAHPRYEMSGWTIDARNLNPVRVVA